MTATPIKYDGRIDLRVRNNSHSISYALIEQHFDEEAGRVLDVGCSSGYLGEALRQRGHCVVGVEPDRISAEQARTRLDRVIVGTIEDFLAQSAGSERFDAMIFGDVLEHTADPAAVLRRCRSHLTERGIVVASVPNVAHVGVRAMLLAGRWDYDERGILDRTHLRFFTKASLVDLLEDAGYTVEAVVPVTLDVEQCGIQVDPGLVAQVRESARDEALDVFQYVALARLRAQPAVQSGRSRFTAADRPRILCAPPLPEWSIGDIRLRNPLAAWTSWHGGAVRHASARQIHPADFDWANVVVLQREADPAVLALIDRCHAAGKYVVFDIDDLLTDVPDFLIAHQHSVWVRPYLVAALQQADLVTTTTERLAAELRTFNASVAVLPNCPLPVPVPSRHYEGGSEPIRLFVASSDTIRVDFLVPALRRLMADPGLSFNLIGIGPPGKYLMEAGLPVAALANVEYEHFGNFLAAHDNAIGLIPLDESGFSSCKSPIKYLDYSQAGLVTVCSAVPPYSDCVEDGLTGLLARNEPDAWYEAVASLARSASLRQRIATAARRKCQQDRSLKSAGDRWEAALEQMMQRPARAASRNSTTEPQPGQPKSALRKLRWLLGNLTQPGAYARAATILVREGPTGIARRVLRDR